MMGLKNSLEIIKQQAALMPDSAGVYKMIGGDNKVLYVGKAKSLPKRVVSYANYDKLSYRISRMVAQICSIEYITTKTEAEALLLEANLVKSLKPVYNISLRDDKSFPYIMIEDGHTYPRITKYRGNKAAKGSYFGPFASASIVNQTVAELQKIFLIRPCTNNFFASRVRPCLQYQIKRCSAPCVGKISQQEYAYSIKQVKNFLTGKSSAIQEELSKLMQQASDNLDFEKAAYIRDKIKTLTAIQAKNTIADMDNSDVDVIAIYKNTSGDSCIEIFFIRGGKNYGNKAYFQEEVSEVSEGAILETFISQFYQNKQIPKDIYLNFIPENISVLSDALSSLAGYKITISTPKNLIISLALDNAKDALAKMLKEKIKHTEELEKIAELFGLAKAPMRIEVYDNSHIQGTNAVGCMVVYSNHGFEKAQYRKFNIKTTAIGDDYEMLREVLTRRMKRLDSNSAPDVMLIDGGKGHLTIALEVLDNFKSDIVVVCIAKGKDRNAGREVFHLKDKDAFQLPKNNNILHFLQILRDEVHRYAIQSHRSKRAKGIRKSVINLIPGIGHNKKRILLQHFGSVDAIMEAGIDELTRVRGINVISARKIYNYLHPDINT